MATAAERRIKLRKAKEIEREAYEKFMADVGIPALVADEKALTHFERIKRKNRHLMLNAVLLQAAEIADIAEQYQQNLYGSTNTGGAAQVARALRAFATGLTAYTTIDDLFLTDWENMDTAPKNRSILIATENGAVGEAAHQEDHGWFWANIHWTDATAEPIADPVAWMPMPIYPK